MLLIVAVGMPHLLAAQDFEFDFAISIGGTGNENANGIHVDGSGNFYIVGEFGEFGGPVDFDPGPGTDVHTSNGGEDNYLSKYDSAGNHLWTRTFGNASNDNVRGPAVDSAGNVYICGLFSGAVNFDPDGVGDVRSSNGGADAYLIQYDSNGNYQWTRTWGGSDSDSANRVAVDTFGNVFVAGHFRSTVDFDPSGGDSHTSNGLTDYSVTKYDSSGNYQWTITMGGPSHDIPQGIVADVAGNIYVAGDLQGTVDFDPGPGTALHTSNGGRDALLAKYDALGNHV